MKDALSWFMMHWPELSGSLGLAAGGTFSIKKLTDKKQNAKIAELETKFNAMDRVVDQVKTDIETNTKFDKQFREQVEESMRDVKTRLDQILGHLLSAK